jgi:hypothetical protein
MFVFVLACELELHLPSVSQTMPNRRCASRERPHLNGRGLSPKRNQLTPASFVQTLPKEIHTIPDLEPYPAAEAHLEDTSKDPA